jgi:hypothetical protein
VDWLNEHQGAPRIELRLAGDLDLSAADGAQGLTVRAQKVTIRPKSPGSWPTLRFSYDLSKPHSAVRAALTLLCQESHVLGLRFLVNGGSSDVAMAGLLLRGGKEHAVERCEFIQVQPSRLASVLAEEERGKPSSVHLAGCAFVGFGRLSEGRLSQVEAGGRDAVVRQGAVRLTAEECAFGPHSAVFRLLGSPREDDGVVTVKKCSVLGARRSAVFDLAQGAYAQVNAEHSLFARCPSPQESGVRGQESGGSLLTPDSRLLTPGCVLIHQADAEGALVYKGKDNCYHDLDGYWSAGDACQG